MTADIASIFSLIIALFCPLVIVAFGGMFSERSGVINLGLEGIMLFSAMFGCMTLQAFNTKGTDGSDICLVQGMEQLIVLLAIVVSVVSGVLFSFLLSFAAIKLKSNQTITGTALNILAPAFGMILIFTVQSATDTTVIIPSRVKLGIELAISNPDNGFLKFMFSDLYLTTPIIIILIVLLSIVLYKTKLGLRLRACGENPQAADSVGINVKRMRYIGTSISGALAGLGGLAYVLVTTSGFQPDVGVAGYGFLALAVMIFGNWKPLGIVVAGGLFVTLRVLATNIDLPFLSNITESGQILAAIPYLVTIIALMIFSKRSHAPKAEGIPYDKSVR